MEVYKLAVSIYCKRIERFRINISNIEKNISSKIRSFHVLYPLSKIEDIIAQKETNEMKPSNEIGSEIITLKSKMGKTARNGLRVSRIYDIVISVIALALPIILMLTVFKDFPSQDANVLNCVIFVACSFLLYFEASIFALQSIGKYLGVFMHVLKVALPLLYGFLIWNILQNSVGTATFEDTIFEGQFSFTFSPAIVIPILQSAVMLFAIVTTNFASEREKLFQGFEVPMSYGSKPLCNKSKLYYYVFIHFLFVVIMLFGAGVYLAQYANDSFLFGLIGIALWIVFPLLKPRGSYLYAFWGPTRCIANEAAFFVSILTFMLLCDVPVGILTFSCFSGAVMIQLLSGGIAHLINNRL